MDQKITQSDKKKKLLKLFLKILITAACLWYVSTKINFRELGATLKHVNWLYLVLAIILYALSKIAGAWRLNIYFKNIQIHLSSLSNLRLYWLGLFYNLFLPGSISGDAYKVVVLSKKFNIPYKKTTAAVVLDRLTGLLGLGLVLAFYSVLVLKNIYYAAGIVFLALLAILVAWLIIKKWFNVFLPGFWPTFFWGLVVQLFANSSAYMIILSLGIGQDHDQYMFIFLVASIAAILPLTLGGLGAREIVFLELSKYFGLPEHSSVLVGFLVYVCVVISSAWGIVYIFTDPLKNQKHETQTGQPDYPQ